MSEHEYNSPETLELMRRLSDAAAYAKEHKLNVITACEHIDEDGDRAGAFSVNCSGEFIDFVQVSLLKKSLKFRADLMKGFKEQFFN